MPLEPIPTEERSDFFRMFAQGLSLKKIAQKTGRSKGTLSKYKILDHWEERRKTIIEEANLQEDHRYAQRLASAQSQVADLRMEAIQRIRDHLLADTQKVTFGDIDKLIRLERFLYGEPDRRTQIQDDFLSESRAYLAELDLRKKEAESEDPA